MINIFKNKFIIKKLTIREREMTSMYVEEGKGRKKKNHITAYKNLRKYIIIILILTRKTLLISIKDCMH